MITFIKTNSRYIHTTTSYHSQRQLDVTGHRWLTSLGNHQFDIIYRQGTSNLDSDVMSCSPEILIEKDEDQNGLIFSKFNVEKRKQLFFPLEHRKMALVGLILMIRGVPA